MFLQLFLLLPSYSYILDFKVIMSTKRKMHTINEKLGIIDKLKRDDSKASLLREFGVPEGAIRALMEEEDKL
jgi:hypothetical protein